MKVLVTGGAGFIGRPTAAALRAGGADVVVLDRAVDPRDDVTDPERVRVAVAGCGAVVHLAAKVGLGVDLGDLTDYVTSNDLGTAVVLAAAARAGVARFVLASSMVVYGEGAYACPRHGAVSPPPRTVADLDAGRFDPRGMDRHRETACLFPPYRVKYLRRKYSATLTSPISTGTSTSGPMTAAKAWPELMPNTATATAMASSSFFACSIRPRTPSCATTRRGRAG